MKREKLNFLSIVFFLAFIERNAHSSIEEGVNEQSK